MHCISQQVTMEAFLTRFQWDSAKFPLRQPLPNIVDGISKVHASTCILYMYNVYIMYDTGLWQNAGQILYVHVPRVVLITLRSDKRLGQCDINITSSVVRVYTCNTLHIMYKKGSAQIQFSGFYNLHKLDFCLILNFEYPRTSWNVTKLLQKSQTGVVKTGRLSSSCSHYPI